MSKSESGKGDWPRPVTPEYYKTLKRLYGETKLNTWERDKKTGKLKE